MARLYAYGLRRRHRVSLVNNIVTDFHSPNGALLGVITAAFSIGAAIAVPLVPYVNDRFGRRACVVVGSAIITIGTILQTASVNGT